MRPGLHQYSYTRTIDDPIWPPIVAVLRDLHFSGEARVVAFPDGTVECPVSVVTMERTLKPFVETVTFGVYYHDEP